MSAYNELLRRYPFLRGVFDSQLDVHQLSTIYDDVSSLEYVISFVWATIPQ